MSSKGFEDMPARLDPLGAIGAEADKARRAPDKVGIMAIKSANDWVDDGLAAPEECCDVLGFRPVDAAVRAAADIAALRVGLG